MKNKKIIEFYKQDEVSTIKRIFDTFYKTTDKNEQRKLLFLSKLILKLQ